jgi:hypothetical protein
MTWRDISVYRYQKIQAIITSNDLDDFEKTMFCVCEAYGLTEQQVNAMKWPRASRMRDRVVKVMSAEPQARPRRRIGIYKIEYNPERYTFGQYIELMFFMQNHIQNAHYVMASISHLPLCRYTSRNHRKRADFFHRCPVLDIIGSIKLFIQHFAEFNAEYKDLFGLDNEVHEPSAIVNRFNKRYGWDYTADSIRERHNITLDEVYRMPLREALGTLQYLKAKSRYETEILKQHQHGR